MFKPWLSGNFRMLKAPFPQPFLAFLPPSHPFYLATVEYHAKHRTLYDVGYV